jgi:TRAP-type C4-dicarboxylate transport system permease small subunit
MRNIFAGLLITICLMIALYFSYQGWIKKKVATISVEWSTASEIGTAGFNLYRSFSVEGPYEKVNEYLIPASPDPLTGGSYSYIDHDVLPGIMYYYELEDVEFNGSTSRSAPIEVRAKSGGWTELVLAFFMAGMAIMGLVVVRIGIKADRYKQIKLEKSEVNE